MAKRKNESFTAAQSIAVTAVINFSRRRWQGQVNLLSNTTFRPFDTLVTGMAQSCPWHISSSFEALGWVSSGAKCASGRPQVKLCSTVISREGKIRLGLGKWLLYSPQRSFNGRQFLSVFKPILNQTSSLLLQIPQAGSHNRAVSTAQVLFNPFHVNLLSVDISELAGPRHKGSLEKLSLGLTAPKMGVSTFQLDWRPGKGVFFRTID